MRVTNIIQKLGYFWLSSKPDIKVPGTLTISDGGRITLDVVGLFDGNSEMFLELSEGNNKPIRFNGLIDGYGYVTLDECFVAHKSMVFGGGVGKSQVRANLALLGVSFDSTEELLFNRFRFSVEGIDEWLQISGISVENNFGTKETAIRYSLPANITVKINDNMTLAVVFSYGFNGLPLCTEAKISQKASFELETKSAISLKDFASIAHKVTTFLGFAIDKPVCINSVFVEVNDIAHCTDDGGVVAYDPIGVYYADTLYIKDVSDVSLYNMLFNFLQVKDKFELVINKWLSAYEFIDPTLNLYFSVKAKAHRYLESRFLALTQGVESYHRRTSSESLMYDEEYKVLVREIVANCPEDNKEWLAARLAHGNELSFGTRLSKMINQFKIYFGESKQRKKLVKSITDTRNYLTHYDAGLKENALKNADLYRACQKIEAILQLHFLLLLGFDSSEIDTVVKNSAELRHKLQTR